MIYALVYIVLSVILAAAVGMLLRVTYPDCSRAHCREHAA